MLTEKEKNQKSKIYEVSHEINNMIEANLFLSSRESDRCVWTSTTTT